MVWNILNEILVSGAFIETGFTAEAGLGQLVVNQQGGDKDQDVFPVDLVRFQNLLQVMQQLLHTEDRSQLPQTGDIHNACILRKSSGKSWQRTAEMAPDMMPHLTFPLPFSTRHRAAMLTCQA